MKPFVYRATIVLALAACVSLLCSSRASAQTAVDDPLHGFCVSPTPVCTDNGVDTPTSTNPLNFGFTISPGPQTGDYIIVVLVPKAVDPSPSALNFTITGTQGGTTNTSALAATATLVSATAFGSGGLDTYLGFSASPANPIGGFQDAEHQDGDHSSTDTFYAYEADLGPNQIQPNPNAANGPLLSISALPKNSIIVSFLLESTGNIATALSGQILDNGSPTPEPASMLLIGTGLVAFGGMLRRKKASN